MVETTPGRVECPECKVTWLTGRGQKVRGSDDTDCSWIGWARRCGMKATTYPVPTPVPLSNGLCAWHRYVQLSRTAAGDFEAFQAWIGQQMMAHVCDVWTHVDIEALWMWVRGEDGKPVESQCLREACVILTRRDRDVTPRRIESAVQRQTIDLAMKVALGEVKLPDAHEALAQILGGKAEDFKPGGRVEQGG